MRKKHRNASHAQNTVHPVIIRRRKKEAIFIFSHISPISSNIIHRYNNNKCILYQTSYVKIVPLEICSMFTHIHTHTHTHTHVHTHTHTTPEKELTGLNVAISPQKKSINLKNISQS